MVRKSFHRFLAIVLIAAQPGWAVPHFKPGLYPRAPHDKMHIPSAAKIHAAGSIHAATISNALGTKNIAVIVVQFPVSSHISGSNSIQSLALIDSYFTQMAAYYSEVSYGNITLHFKFFGNLNAGLAQNTAVAAGKYTLANPEEYYGCGDEGEANVAPCSSVTTPPPDNNGSTLHGNYLIRDALIAAHAADPTLSSTNFDGVIVMHAGNGNETTNSNGDIWSIFYPDDSKQPIIQSAGCGFTEADVIPETESSGIASPLGVMCHEFGHSLGLPDLYNTTAIGGSSVNGKWEIMDSGAYDGAGANPTHMCGWDKMTLGWVTPTSITTKTSTSLGYAEIAPASLLKLPIQNGGGQEYFLVEYRSTAATGASYDHSIPGTGLLVWHIDDAITSSRGIDAVTGGNTVNTGSPHYGVSIVAADGIFVGSTGGTANNAFGNNHTFTSPSSDNFAGQPSGITIVNITGVGGATASFQVVNLAVTAGQTISRLANFPNPAGKGYTHPNGPGHTTIQMQLTRPAGDFSFNIYTLSGDLVRKIGKDEITLNTDRSLDYKWVYEFVWDLTNGDGKMVAPGVYLYLARADGQTKSGKAVIIR